MAGPSVGLVHAFVVAQLSVQRQLRARGGGGGDLVRAVLELAAHHGLDELLDLGRGVVAEVVEQRRPDRAHADVVLSGLLLEHPDVRRQRKRPARDGGGMGGLCLRFLAALLLMGAAREADADVLERTPYGPDE